ncbi:MAG: NAD(P)-dependent alcohol dehydrogenase [Bacteroidota bacterium]
MKAYVATAYGPPEVLQLREVPRPTPGPNGVRIRVQATTVTAGDWRVRSLEVPAGFGLLVRLLFGFTKPRQPILGSEAVGVVDAVGAHVTRFVEGDPVIAYADTRLGTHAEYVILPEDGPIVHRPDGLSLQEAAAFSFGGTTALHFFDEGGLRAGHRVLVNGASGAVGTAAVQLAVQAGAHVTGVCSTANLDLVRSLGAHEVVDYTTTDVVPTDVSYDLILDAAGTLPYPRARPLLAPAGRLLVVNGSALAMLRGPWVALTSRHRLVTGTALGSITALRTLVEYAEAGAYRPVIDRCYPFEEMVEAHRYVDQGHKRGNVVVWVEAEAEA